MNHSRNSSWTTAYEACPRKRNAEKMSKILKVYTVLRLSQRIFCSQFVRFRFLGQTAPSPTPSALWKAALPLIFHTNVNLLPTRLEERVHSSTEQLFPYCTREGTCRRDTSFQAEPWLKPLWKLTSLERDLQLNLIMYKKCWIHYANSCSGVELPLEQNGNQLLSCYVLNTMPFLKETHFW